MQKEKNLPTTISWTFSQKKVQPYEGWFKIKSLLSYRQVAQLKLDTTPTNYTKCLKNTRNKTYIILS
jgi:hypothetical protein